MLCQLRLDKILGIEILDLGGDLDSKIRCVKTRNITNAALAGTYAGPAFFSTDSHRG